MNETISLGVRTGRAMLRGLIRLALLLAVGILMLSVLLAALLGVTLWSLWSLLRGRRPAPVVMFERARAHSRRFARGMWSDQPARGEVVDVVAEGVNEQADDPRAQPQRLERLS